MTDDDFDLRHIIRGELATSPVADPHIVAEHILKRIRDDYPEHVWDALGATLPQTVRTMITDRHHHRPTPTPAGTRPAGWSGKRDAKKFVRDLLAGRLEIGDGDREWKFLRDCNRAEVLRAAKYRRSLAAANAAKADQYEQLAEKMRVYRAETVADLDAALIAEVFA